MSTMLTGFIAHAQTLRAISPFQHRYHYLYASHFCTLTKEQRQQRLEEKFKPNTTLPKRVGHIGGITAEQLVYTPKSTQQLEPQFYASHVLNPSNLRATQHNKAYYDDAQPQTQSSSSTDASETSDAPDLSKVTLFEYAPKLITTERSEWKNTMHISVFAVVSLTAPLFFFGTTYLRPDWYTGAEHFERSLWVHAGISALLVAGFGVALRQQMSRWTVALRRKISASTMFVSKISLVHPNMLCVDYCHNTLFHNKTLTHNIELGSSTPNQVFYLRPSLNDVTQTADVECVMDLPDKHGESVPVQLSKDGKILNWQSFITFFKDIPNAAGKFQPVAVDQDGYIAVASYDRLLQSPRTTLTVYSHGIPPYKAKNAYLFVPNLKKDELFVVYDRCKSRNESLIHNAAFYEEKNKTFLHCQSCHQSRLRNVTALSSCVDWKIATPQDGKEAMVYIKLDASMIRNPLQFTDAFGHAAMESFLNFYCTNSFRLAHPKTPQTIGDVFVLGELQFYDDWKSDNSPSLTPLKSETTDM